MLPVLEKEENLVRTSLLRLYRLAAFVRGDSGFYKPFPGPKWFNAERMAEINRHILNIRSYAARRPCMETQKAIEVYYLHLLAKYQYEAFGGGIGPDEQNMSKRQPKPRKPRSLKSWYKLLDYMSDMVFWWSKEKWLSVAQIESLTRIWLLVYFYHRLPVVSGSLQYANNVRNTLSHSSGRKPGSRCRARRTVRRSRRPATVSKSSRPGE